VRLRRLLNLLDQLAARAAASCTSVTEYSIP